MTNNLNSFEIKDFLNLNKETFMGLLHENTTQSQAWENQFEHLQNILQGIDGRIIFEYGIPGLKRVIDVVLLIKGLVFVLEYKNGEVEFKKEDKRQALGYALRLKFYHSKSNDRKIIPILVATAAKESLHLSDFVADDVWDVICSNSNDLRNAINKFCEKEGKDCDRNWENEWENGAFKSSPTIIRAACNVWERKNVKNISECDVNPDIRLDAEKYISQVVKDCEHGKKKAIVFVTGVPGAGKTLVGLNVSIDNQQYGASMISGNGPLVEVLSSALRRDLEKQYKANNLKEEVCTTYEKTKKADKQSDRDKEKDKISVDTIIRGAYSYKKEIIEKRLSWEDGSYAMKSNAERNSQHVVIFDEAQRAWTKEKMLTPGQRGRKDWQKEDWPFSEPGLLLWDMNQQDWGVFVCLVGGGQEINTGEAGINEWLRALATNEFKDWEIHMSSNLVGEEYGQKDSSGKCVKDYVNSEMKDRIRESKNLHLTETQRTLRSELVSTFVNGLINLDIKPNFYKENIEKFYKIYLTRDNKLAKSKLTELRDRLQSQKEAFESIDDIKMGMLMSSNAERLRPIGYEVKKVASFDKKVAPWFLDKKEENIDSCDSLEIALDEFFVQGLELDLCCVMWDADFRYSIVNGKPAWKYFKFKKCKWNEIVEEKISGREKEAKKKEKEETNRKREIIKFYMKNAYRVLLTRARMGLIIFVPEGDQNDPTRLPKFYDTTYNYLKSLGLTELK